MRSSIFSLEIVKRVGLITGKILSYDGTLFPTFANYRGCNYACEGCKSIPLKEDFPKSLRYRIIDSLNHPSKITLGKERRSFAICSNHWRKTRNLRSASERSNGTCKSSDLDILESPRLYGLGIASIEASMACITTLLKRMMSFVMRITLNLIKYLKTWDKSYKKKLAAPMVPTFILSLIQRKRSPP